MTKTKNTQLKELIPIILQNNLYTLNELHLKQNIRTLPHFLREVCKSLETKDKKQITYDLVNLFQLLVIITIKQNRNIEFIIDTLFLEDHDDEFYIKVFELNADSFVKTKDNELKDLNFNGVLLMTYQLIEKYQVNLNEHIEY